MKRSLSGRRVSRRALAWLCTAALLASLVPLYALGFYNHPCYDDFGYTIRTHAVWRATGSFQQTLREAVRNTIDTRQTWEGNYASTFVNAMQPALFGEGWYWVSTAALLTVFLLAVGAFLWQTLVKRLRADRSAFWLVYSLLALVVIQFVPQMSEAFFWHAGGMAYTMLWSVMLLRMALWLHVDAARTRCGRAAGYLGLAVLTVVVGGAKFSTTLLALLTDGLWLLYLFQRKRPCRWAAAALTALMLGCFLFCVTSPGNAVRAETLHSTVSAPMAVAQAFYFGVALMGHWFNLPLLVAWAAAAWFLLDALRASALRFKRPVWVTLIGVCLFCAQLAPTLYTGNYLGDGRTLNSYYYTYALLGGALALYWTGWGLRRLERYAALPPVGARGGLRVGALLAALALLVVGCLCYQPEGRESWGPQNMASGSALRSLMNGEAAAYDAAMTARDLALNDPSQPEVTLTPVDTVPPAFMGDALNSGNRSYVLNLYTEYYQKRRVSVAGEE